MGKVLVSPLFVFHPIRQDKRSRLAFLASESLPVKFPFHTWSTTHFQLHWCWSSGLWTFAIFFFFFTPFFPFFFSCDPKKGGEKHPVIWIHSFEELYKILTILPGAKLELDAVRINWWSFAKRVEKTSFAKSKSYKPPAGVVRGRLVGIVAAYVWCQEHHWFAFLLYEFYKAEMLFCVEVIPKVSVAINHKWNLSADEKP